jgi:gluconolactonase
MTTTSSHNGRDPGAFLAHSPEFLDVLGDEPSLSLVVAADAHEGPVYAADEDALYFTSSRTEGQAPTVSIGRVALDGARFPLEPARVTTVVGDANAANGMTLDPAGRLLVCEQGSLTRAARISAYDRSTGARSEVVSSVGGLPLNSPNDIVVARDGAVWFTDPSYGWLQGFRPEPIVPDRVYRHDPRSGETRVAAAGFDKPNGVALSPDERRLYVTDNGRPHRIVAFDVEAGGMLGPGLHFAAGDPGHPDGLKVDREGRVYGSSTRGIHVLDPGGRLIGEILVPGAVNFTFGGRDGDLLFITADTAIWAARLGTPGIHAAQLAETTTRTGA